MPAFGARPPKDFEWQIGKTAAEIEARKQQITPGQWDYIGDYVVGVEGDCGCTGQPHESHSVVVALMESELPEGVSLAEHTANCKLIAKAPMMLEIIKDLYQEEPCRFDHHGYCQAHDWFATDPKCPHARIRDLGITKET